MYIFHHAVWLASLGSEQVVIKEKCTRPFFVYGCHGNTEINVRTKFHLHGLRV